jgi:hypothetical protein
VSVSLAYFWSAHLPYNEYERVLSGDFGDFASFVSHMKAIAKVNNQIILLIKAAAYGFVDRCRRRTSICCWLTLVTSTMVSNAACFSHNSRAGYAKGTGLTDGFPPNGVDGHEVRVQVLSYAAFKDLRHIGQQIL